MSKNYRISLSLLIFLISHNGADLHVSFTQSLEPFANFLDFFKSFLYHKLSFLHRQLLIQKMNLEISFQYFPLSSYQLFLLSCIFPLQVLQKTQSLYQVKESNSMRGEISSVLTFRVHSQVQTLKQAQHPLLDISPDHSDILSFFPFTCYLCFAPAVSLQVICLTISSFPSEC